MEWITLLITLLIILLMADRAFQKTSNPKNPPKRRKKATALIVIPTFLYLIYLFLVAVGFNWNFMFG